MSVSYLQLVYQQWINMINTQALYMDDLVPISVYMQAALSLDFQFVLV